MQARVATLRPRRSLETQPENAEFRRRLAPARTAAPLDAAGHWVATLDSEAEQRFRGFELVSQRSYRLGLEAVVVGGCSAEGCPELVVRLQGAEVLRTRLSPPGNDTALHAAVIARATGTAELSFGVSGGRLEVGGLSLVPADHTLSFDHEHERLSAVLLDSTFPDVPPALMRFVGDGASGFEARLLPGERMAVTRLALPIEFTAFFSASPDAELNCGVLGDDSLPIATVDCSSGSFRFAAGTEVPAGARALFVDNVGVGNAVVIDNLRVTSLPVPTEPGADVGAIDASAVREGGSLGVSDAGVDAASATGGRDAPSVRDGGA